VPRARDRSSGSIIHEVISESRPNSVMNQGAPAATTSCAVSSVPPRPKIRSEPRSSALVANVAATRSSGVISSGLRRRQLASRLAGALRSMGSPSG
jgi:hypothetical protein